jgi:hypothetical protein
MKQKEERDLENALAWDGMDGNIEVALAAIKVDEDESRLFFKEAGKTLVGEEAIFLHHRRKRVAGNLAKHWFIYEYPERKEVRLLTSDQIIDGEMYSFMDGNDQLVFSYR